jgi:hypothetical protein
MTTDVRTSEPTQLLQVITSELCLLGPCSRPLGLMSGSVHDWQLSASSSYPTDRDPECNVRFARLHQPRARAWCAMHKSPNEWILVDLGVPAQVTQITVSLFFLCIL